MEILVVELLVLEEEVPKVVEMVQLLLEDQEDVLPLNHLGVLVELVLDNLIG
jgi:hypothetical protein